MSREGTISSREFCLEFCRSRAQDCHVFSEGIQFRRRHAPVCSAQSTSCVAPIVQGLFNSYELVENATILS